MTTQTITHIRGATFSYAGTASLPAGEWTALSTLRDQRGTVISNLTVTLTAPTAPETAWPLVLEASASSSELWPVGILRGDVRFADGTGVVLYTSRFMVNVEEHLTNAPA